MNFWNKETEIRFFKEALKAFATPEKLFYRYKDNYFAYFPKNIKAKGQTLQSRNSLIGQFTEKWCKDFFEPITKELKLKAVNGVICPELGLTRHSPGDLAFCKSDDIEQKPCDIKLLFEIKMSIVNNYKYDGEIIEFIGDYTTHIGVPSLLRSDSVLKAIGKSVNIRTSSKEASIIPIIILGNSPITKYYAKKIDLLKNSGIIQRFISLYPEIDLRDIKKTEGDGFVTYNNYQRLFEYIKDLIKEDFHFFSSMLPLEKLGEIIEQSSKEKDFVSKAKNFINLIS